MNKKIILIAVISLLLLTGCYDYKELNTIGIISATEISKDKDGFIVKAHVINPHAPDKTTITETPFIIYTAHGKTLQEAFRNITSSSTKFLYSNHLQILIINESIAKKNLNDIVDFFARNPSIRTEFYVLIGKNENILNMITPGSITSSNIKKIIETNQEYLGTSNIVTFNEFLNMYLDKHKEIVLPSIESINHNKESENIKNTEKSNLKSKYQLSTLAIFKNNKLKSYLTKEESLTYNILKNNIKNSILTYPCQSNEYLTLEIIDSKTKIKSKKNKLFIDIKLKTNLNEIQCNINIEERKKLNKLKKDIEKYLQKKILKNINNIRNNYNSDIFDFIDIIYKHNHSYYQKVKNTWYQGEYQHIKININPHIEIIEKGKILEVMDEKN